MTIASATSRIGYTGNGSTTAFAVPFYFAANADLVVTVQDLAGAVTTKLLGTDYNLTGATLSAGGTCTFVAAPTLNYIIAITRVPALTQTTSYNNSDPFAAKSHELALDKLTTVDQYLKSLLDRAILVPTTDTPPFTTLPAASQRALKNLSFDAAGNPSATTPVTGTTISSVMIPVATSSTLALARAAFFGTPGTNESQTIAVSGSGTLDLKLGATGHITAGGGAYTGDDAGLLMNRTLAPVSGLLNSHGFRDETVATVNVTGSAFSGYAAFDAATQILGTNTTPTNHLHGFQARGLWSASGHCQEWAGYTAQPTVTNAAGIIDNAYGFFMFNSIISAGGIVNQYGFYSNPLSGATNSYFLYGAGTFGTTANPSVLSGGAFFGGRTSALSTEVMNVQYNGSVNQGFLFADTYASAATLTAASFYRNNVLVGSVTTTLAATAYNTSSDERLKTFTGHYDAAEAIRILRADPVRTFTWDTTGEAAIGWGAQTSYALSPDLATPGVGDLDDANWHPWGIDFSKRVPYLWTALNNALDRIDALEAEKIALAARLGAIEARLMAAGI